MQKKQLLTIYEIRKGSRKENAKMTEQKSKKQLMRQIQMATFSLIETSQFLNSHKDDEQALSALAKYNETRNSLIKEYEKTYGALFVGSDNSAPYSFVTSPFPWETED